MGPILTAQLRLSPVSLSCRPALTEVFASLQDLTALICVLKAIMEPLSLKISYICPYYALCILNTKNFIDQDIYSLYT